MEAIVLAGGFGTRLRHIVSDVPKPMAPVAGRPFLEYILKDLAAKGVTRAVLAVGYMAECIKNHFGGSFAGMELVYSPEDKPLFTGGAIKQALAKCTQANILVVNGDTFFDVDLAALEHVHTTHGAVLTVATKEMTDFDRYGTVRTDADGRITAFEEKKPCARGAINGGVYLLRRDALNGIAAEKFSFEQEFMERFVREGRFFACPCDGYFIDIGVPEDYARAQEDFASR